MGFGIEQLEAAGVTFAMAAQLVGVEPADEWVASCVAEDLFAEAPFGVDDTALAAGMVLMRTWMATVGDADVVEAAASLRREWLRLFVGVGTPKAPVWESFYVEANSPMMSRATIEVRACYRKYGLAFERQGNEPDDSLGLMLAYCAHVQRCEVEALAAGDDARAEECAADLGAFVKEHLLPWMAAWRYSVEKYADSDYYRGVGLFVFGLLRCYAGRFGVAWSEESQRFVAKETCPTA